MNNIELKNKFEEIQNKISDAESKNQETSTLLKTKYDLLKIGYEKIKEATEDEKFDKSQRKYSMLLSYVNSMKKIAEEIQLPQDEVTALENEVKAEMEKNNLSWLLDI